MKNFKSLGITVLISTAIGLSTFSIANASSEKVMKPLTVQQVAVKKHPAIQITAKEIKSSKGVLPEKIYSQLKRQGIKLTDVEEKEINKLIHNVVNHTNTGDSIQKIKIRVDIDLKEKTISIKIIF